MTTKTCSIKLLNKTYDIKCPEHEEDNLKKAAHKINEQLQANKAKFNHLGEFQNLLLASLHISHELVAFQEQHHQQQDPGSHPAHGRGVFLLLNRERNH